MATRKLRATRPSRARGGSSPPKAAGTAAIGPPRVRLDAQVPSPETDEVVAETTQQPAALVASVLGGMSVLGQLLRHHQPAPVPVDGATVLRLLAGYILGHSRV